MPSNNRHSCHPDPATSIAGGAVSAGKQRLNMLNYLLPTLRQRRCRPIGAPAVSGYSHPGGPCILFRLVDVDEALAENDPFASSDACVGNASSRRPTYLQETLTSALFCLQVERRKSTMDPVSTTLLASAAVKFLVPYLNDAAEGFAKEVGKSGVSAALARAKELYGLITNKFRESPAGPKIVEELANSPDDANAQSKLRAKLDQEFQLDEKFATQVKEMLKQVAATRADVSFVNNIMGDVGKVVQIDSVIGNVSF
jgi:hypothetical protein